MFAGVRHFFTLCWGYNKKYILLLGLGQVVGVALAFITLYLPKSILDAIFTYQNISLAFLYVGVFLGSTFVLNSVGQLIARASSNERMKTFYRFQLDLAERMMSAKLEKIESQSFLSLKAKAEQYLYGGGQGFATVLEESFGMVGMFCTLIIYVVTIAQLHIVVVLALSAILAINLWLNSYYQKKNIAINLEKASQERRSGYYSTVFQDFTYGKEIRANDLRSWLLEKYQNQLKTMQGFYRNLNKNNFWYGILSLNVTLMQQIISYGYLMFQAVQSAITVGSFSLYLQAITSFSSTIKGLIGQIITMRQYTIYYQAYKEYMGVENIFESTQQATQNSVSTDTDMIIEFKNVGFAYPHTTTNAVENLNVTLHKGDKIAIVGKNGAGKSTFIKLLLRMYQPTEGVITLQGVDIQTIPYAEYMQLFATVFQDYKLFAQSIVENITFNPHTKDTQCIHAILQEIGIDKKIADLEQGLDTSVYKTFDNQGYIPSEGEAQKLAFARAMYKNAPVVILDEPSSSLDPQAEFEVYKIFHTMTQDKTCLFISHRLAITSFSNRVLVFDNARIVESGTHDELMGNGELYHSLYTMQAKYYNKE